MTPRADYGYDAPYAPIVFGALGVAASCASIVLVALGHNRPAAMAAFYGVFFLGNAASFLYTTRRGKFIVWERILDGLALRGDERVLDLGCGRGAVLTAVARRLTTGRATGIDLWVTRDQSGNAIDVTRRNAELEGVADRVDVRTGDMRATGLPDGSFDVVVSSLAIHNLRSRADRVQVIAEVMRVLAPLGRVAIADIRTTGVYASALKDLGALDVKRERLGWRFWYGNPFAATTLVTARRPSSFEP